MNDSSNNSGKKPNPYSPKTSEERNAAFKLLDELEKEYARQQVLREKLVQSLAGLKPPVPGPQEISDEDQEKFNESWGKFMHPEEFKDQEPS